MQNRNEFISGLRSLVDFLESNPEIDLPKGEISIYHFEAGESIEVLKEYAKAFGVFDRTENDNTFTLSKHFGGGVKLRAIFFRDAVCVKTVIGTKKETTSIPDPEFNVPMIEVEREIEVTEWSCPQSLLS